MKTSAKNGSAAAANGKPAKASRALAKRKNGRPESKTNGQPEAPARFYGSALPGVKSEELSGNLIVLEGTDGSGKSTQLYLLKRWLEIGGYRLHFTEWNSSPLVKSATRRGKQRRLLTPTTFSLLHAADFTA